MSFYSISIQAIGKTNGLDVNANDSTNDITRTHCPKLVQLTLAFNRIHTPFLPPSLPPSLQSLSKLTVRRVGGRISDERRKSSIASHPHTRTPSLSPSLPPSLPPTPSTYSKESRWAYQRRTEKQQHRLSPAYIHPLPFSLPPFLPPRLRTVRRVGGRISDERRRSGVASQPEHRLLRSLPSLSQSRALCTHTNE